MRRGSACYIEREWSQARSSQYFSSRAAGGRVYLVPHIAPSSRDSFTEVPTSNDESPHVCPGVAESI